MTVLVWLIYNLSVLATSLYLTIHFNSGWWMLLVLIASTDLKTKRGTINDKYRCFSRATYKRC